MLLSESVFGAQDLEDSQAGAAGEDVELQRTTILPGSGAGGSLDGSAATIHLDSGHDSSGASLYLDSTLQKATQGLESLRMRSTALQHKQSEHQVRFGAVPLFVCATLT